MSSGWHPHPDDRRAAALAGFTVDPADSPVVRADLATVPASYGRIRAEAETSAEPDDLDALRPRAGQ